METQRIAAEFQRWRAVSQSGGGAPSPFALLLNAQSVAAHKRAGIRLFRVSNISDLGTVVKARIVHA